MNQMNNGFMAIHHSSSSPNVKNHEMIYATRVTLLRAIASK